MSYWKEQQISQNEADERAERPDPEMLAATDHADDDRVAYRAARRATIRAEVNAIKLAKGCAVCGFAEAAVALEFHHIDPEVKHRDIGRMVSIGAGMGAITREISKCVVLCANHHAMATDTDRKARA